MAIPPASYNGFDAALLQQTLSTAAKHDRPLLAQVSQDASHGTRVAEPNKEKKRLKVLTTNVATYLGPGALQYDDIIYGDTPIHAVIKHSVDTTKEEEARKAGISGIKFRDQVVFDMSLHARRSGQGRQLLVNRCIKAYLMTNNASQPTRFVNQRNDVCAGMRARTRRNPNSALASTSMTIIRTKTKPVAIREPCKDWRRYGEMYEMAYVHPGYADQWQAIFDKYENTYEDPNESPLPLYGDSGSENNYDSETWEDMETEKEEKQARPAAATLSSPQTLEAIAAAKQDLQQRWNADKRPKLETTAYAVWKKALKNGGLKHNIRQLKFEIDRLQNRMTALEKHVTQESWLRTEDVHKQCEVLQNTLFDICNAEFKIQILSATSPPVRPPPTQSARPRQRQPRQKKPPAEEEDLTDEDDDGFVDDDSFVIPENDGHLSNDMPHIQQTFTDVMPNIRDGNAHVANKPGYPPSRPDEPLSIHTIDTANGDPEDESQSVLRMDIKELLKKKDWVAHHSDGRIRIAWEMASSGRARIRDVQRFLTRTNMDISRFSNSLLAGLKALKSKAYRVRSVDDKDNHTVLHLGRWRYAWSAGIWETKDPTFDFEDEVDGPSQSELITALIESWPPSDLHPFLSFVEERLQFYLGANATHQTVSSKRKGDSDSDDEPLIDGRHRNKGRPRKHARDSLGNIVQVNTMERRRKLHALLMQYPSTLVEQPIANEVSTGLPAIRINPHIARVIQPHQLDGVRFLWRETVTGKESQGCLLAHSMGTGKTVQVVAFLNTLAEAAASSEKRIRRQVRNDLRKPQYLVIPPPSLVGNWHDEFLKWLPTDMGGIGNLYAIWPGTSVSTRSSEIDTWHKTGGVLLISSNLFRDIVMTDPKQAGGDGPAYDRMGQLMCEHPSVVVVDEAQDLKNENSKLSRAVHRVRTGARIGMTGSPLANSLDEYFNLIDWVAPNYLGTQAEFRDKYASPISDGLYADSSTAQKRRALKFLDALTRGLEPKVHRVDNFVLDKQLYGKTEFLIRVPLTVLQSRCYSLLVLSIRDAIKGEIVAQTRLWAYLYLFRLLCNHPYCLHEHLLDRQKIAPSVNELLTTKGLPLVSTNGALQAHNSQTASSKDSMVPDTLLQEKVLKGGNDAQGSDQGDELEEAAERLAQQPSLLLGVNSVKGQLKLLMHQPDLQNYHFSNKMVLIQEILQLSHHAGEKVLVFSHSLPTMDFVIGIIKKLKLTHCRIDGTVNTTIRNDIAKQFNEGSTNVCVISTTAGGTGLNLFGASRVIIVDEWYNPMHEQQAIGRAYRIGQVRPVIVYRLMTAGTYEETMQNLSAFKSNLASRVVDRKKMGRQATKDARIWLRPVQDVPFEAFEDVKGKDARVLDPIISREKSENSSRKIQSVEIGNSYVVDWTETLTEEEKKEADELLDDGRRRRTGVPPIGQPDLARSLTSPAITLPVPLTGGIPGTTTKVPETSGSMTEMTDAFIQTIGGDGETVNEHHPPAVDSRQTLMEVVPDSVSGNSEAYLPSTLSHRDPASNQLALTSTVHAQPEANRQLEKEDISPGSEQPYSTYPPSTSPRAEQPIEQQLDQYLNDILSYLAAEGREWLPLQDAEKVLLLKELERRAAEDPGTVHITEQEVAECVQAIREQVNNMDQTLYDTARVTPMVGTRDAPIDLDAAYSPRPTRSVQPKPFQKHDQCNQQ